MVNKKGFIRTLEAVIAIVLILGFIFYITPRVTEFEAKVPENVANAKEFILNQILFNKEYSKCIADAKTNVVGSEEKKGNCEDAILDACTSKTKIIDLFKSNVPYGYSWWCEICPNTKSICTDRPDSTLEKSVYTNSIFVYKGENIYNIMRIYIWKT